MPAFRIIVIVALIAVVASLFSALYYLYHDRGEGMRMVRMLGVRVGISAALIAFLVAAYYLGWVPDAGVR